MNCKNCKQELEKDAQFCNNCGAKIIKSRITFKFLVTDLLINIFGVDSKFFLTLKKLLTHPDEVLSEYITGVRKRYINPFAFFAISAALSLIIYNFFADEYIAIQATANQEQVAELKKLAEMDLSSMKDISEENLKQLKAKKQVAQFQIKYINNVHSFTLKYFNILMFLFLPFYALLSKWTYRKPHNYGEHIVMNAYLYGFLTYFSILAFFLSIVIHPSIFYYSMILYLGYYLFAFGKLYTISFGKSLVKLLRFLLGLLIFSILLVIIVSLTLGLYIGMSNPDLFKPA